MPSQPGHAPHACEVSTAPPKPRVADAPVAAHGKDAPLRVLQRSIGNRAVAKLARSTGRPLEPAVRDDFEGRFGEDLGALHVHHDPKTAESLGARAAAVGEHIVTDTPPEQGEAARQLLAHEAAHTIQQRRHDGAAESANDDALEAEAKHAAHEVGRGAQRVTVKGKAKQGIARQEEGQPRQPSFSTVPSDDGFLDLFVVGVKVIHYQAPDPEHPHDLDVGTFWTSDHPNAVYLGVWGKQTTTALLDMKGIEELRQRGLDVIHKDNRQPVDLGEHPIHVGAIAQPTPPTRRRSPAPKSPDKKVQDKTPPAKLPDTPTEDTKSDQLTDTLPPLPADTQEAATPATIPTGAPPAPKDLIDQRTSWWGNLDEDALGADLLKQAMNSEPDYTQHVLDELGSTDRDDVALAFAHSATDEQLQQLAATEKGRRLLDRLFDELTAGIVVEEEQQQADRILGIKTHSRLSEGRFAAGMDKAQSRHGIILPYRKTGMTVMTPSPIYANRMPDGKVAVRLRHDIFGTDYARDRDLRLPPNIWDLVILDEDEIVGVKMYDEGGTVQFMPALKLVQYANESDRIAIEKAAEAFGIGLTLGLGGEAAAGGEATEGSTLSTTARIAAGARTGLAYADTAATALDIGNSILQEHRGWVIENSPEDGRNFVLAMDKLTSYVRIYGLVRGSVGLVQLGNSLRKSYRNWRAFTGAMKDVSESDVADIEEIGRDTENLLRELDSSAQQNVAASDAPGADVRDITSAQQRRYPPAVARKLEATPQGAGDVKPLHATAAANDNVELEGEIPQQLPQQRLDEQQVKLASGDIETRAMAGPRGPKGPPVKRGGTTRTTATPTTGGRFGGGAAFGSPRPPRRFPPEHIEEPKLPPRDLKHYTKDYKWNFFHKYRDTYPKHVQDMIDAWTVPTHAEPQRIEAALKADWVQQMNVGAGYPAEMVPIRRPADVPGGSVIEPSSPFKTAVKEHAPSTANAGAEYEAGITPTPSGDRKNLNVVAVTKDWERVDIDEINVHEKIFEEIKMPNFATRDPRYKDGYAPIIDELRRYLKLAGDWTGWRALWKLRSINDYLLVKRLADENFPDWAEHMDITFEP